FLVDNNAAILVQQRDLTEDRLTDILKDLFESPEKRLAMANAAYELRRIDVSENIYQICLSI
ncbi:MAG TPA: UDP-N-acetylglucosamine--N-acetylmuramyl-(pentapeptide) pyrophosphoryl-undecaprenol N-acetylglucosamine transferase, partial [Gammaproteobacteria bacterium]|nr:UDP-N-acetylglucosamine--N-acetylmuramyl-(pentapeptide) pyrophosphoryl-undecaprenol N-acetylglucosamine transferase [Gammaproteobacteria bacterium]